MTILRNLRIGPWLWTTVAILAGGLPAAADGPADNQPDNVRRIPKLGVEVSDADQQELEAGLKSLAEKIEKLGWPPLMPDVLIFHRAVDQALRYQEFFDAKEIPVAKKLLAIGHERADQLLDGKSPWTQQTGLVVRGYFSRIDHSVQPYGLVIPDDHFTSPGRKRCDLWFHGRGETLSEVNFINQRLTNKGEFTPPNTIVLHPYGRYCNANKFAGEIDTFEALEHAQRNYRINPERIAVRGFSMGGAACWQFAVHYPGKWFAANPGAGFSETPDFLKVFQNETLQPTWYEQKLWRMYDCTGYAANLAFLPTVAYSGEIDKQKQAADMMEAALKTEHLPLIHIIGPMTAHKIHPDSKVEIEQQLGQWASRTNREWPDKIQFVTFSLIYPSAGWVDIEEMEEHWEEARVVAERLESMQVNVTTKNIAKMHLRFPKEWRDSWQGRPTIKVDGQTLPEGSFVRGKPPEIGTILAKQAGKWIVTNAWDEPYALGKKTPQTCGPIDHAFMDAFLFVKPTSKGVSDAVDKWVQKEFEHAVTHWRQHFRGDARVKLDTEVTADDMQSANVVLWGDPKSNDALVPIFKSLPITWDLAEGKLKAGDQTWDAATHLPLMIYPNPLAPNRYVVLNSSFTFREYDYLNNARQTPKLPDWAIVDIRTPPNSRFPGKVVAADFFDEQWRLKTK